MKRILSFFIIFCCVAFSVSAQELIWSKHGNSYYSFSHIGISECKLPSFQDKVLVETARLIPEGKQDPLQVRSFSFSEDGKKLLVYTNSKRVWRRNTRGDYWVLNLENNKLNQLGKGMPESSLMFAKFSPDGSRVAYVSEHNLYVEEIGSGKITPLTKDGTRRMINGTFDWAYEEEFDCRDGFRWSPDGKKIAYWQIDATSIKNFLLINNTDSLYSFTIPIEYPKAGEDPSACKVGVISLETGKTQWMKIPGDPQQHYIPRMEWSVNGDEIILEQLNRRQNEAKIFTCNVVSGAAKNIYTENDAAWIDVKARWSDDPTGWDWLENGKSFLWVSEKDGWRHIYKIGKDGKETLLTKGEYDVITVKAVNEKEGYVYFTASPESAVQAYLYRIDLKGKGKMELLSPEQQMGTHDYKLSPTAEFAFHDFSNHKNEEAAGIIRLPDHLLLRSAIVWNASEDTSSRIEMFQITTDDGVTMDGWMVKPLNFDSTKKYPVLFTVYAEPAGTTVRDAAGMGRSRQYKGDLAADGYIFMSVEGRGTPVPKGAAWRKAIYRNIGAVNVRDQAMAAKKIRQWPFVDSARIAVTGWSGGGSTTLNLLFQYPDIYQTGIAIAPVPNQLLYDNIYQERFMGLPQDNMEDYLKGSPITHAKNLKGNLLIVHGTGDDNVHYQGTEMLINELIKHGKQFQMMSYPNRTHGISEGEGTSEHLAGLFTEYLKEHCPGGGR